MNYYSNCYVNNRVATVDFIKSLYNNYDELANNKSSLFQHNDPVYNKLSICQYIIETYPTKFGQKLEDTLFQITTIIEKDVNFESSKYFRCFDVVYDMKYNVEEFKKLEPNFHFDFFTQNQPLIIHQMLYYQNLDIPFTATVGLFLLKNRQDVLKKLSCVDYVDTQNSKLIRFRCGCLGELIYDDSEVQKREIKSGVIPNENLKIFDPNYYTGTFLVSYYNIYKEYMTTLGDKNHIGYEYLINHPYLLTLTKMIIGKVGEFYVLDSIQKFCQLKFH